MAMTEKLYHKVAIEDPTGKWEFVCGRLRSKPGMTIEHNVTMWSLVRQLMSQLNEREYEVRADLPRLHVSTGSYYLPDVCVIPRALGEQKLREEPRRLEVYDQPMPLVVEVWSPSTGDYDIEEKLCEYQRRGDLEIWRLHPYEKTLTRWQRRPYGGYKESLIQSGTVRPVSLPTVCSEFESLIG